MQQTTFASNNLLMSLNKNDKLHRDSLKKFNGKPIKLRTVCFRIITSYMQVVYNIILKGPLRDKRCCVIGTFKSRMIVTHEFLMES